MSFDINIISTGSKGNSLIIDNKIMIDAGLSYKHIGQYLETVDKILITHRHGDHINIPAIRKLHKLKPWKLQKAIHCNRDVADKIEQSHNTKFDFIVPNSQIIDDDSHIIYESNGDIYEIDTFKCIHDVENQGFVITKNYTTTLLFATDTSTIDFAPDNIKYDYIILEGNYDEDRLNDVMENGSNDEAFRAMRNLRHLSIQQFNDFINKNSHSDTFVKQLHESEMFGLQSQNRKDEQNV